MADPRDALSLDQEQRIAAAELSEKSAKISEILSEAVEKVHDSSALEHIGAIFPWLSHAVDFAGEALPPIKAVAKAIEKATAIDDPLDLGMVACTAAYQQACIEAFSLIGKPRAAIAFYSTDAIKATKAELKEKLALLEKRDRSLLENFSLSSAATHRFTKTADAAFVAASTHFGYDQPERNRLLTVVHRRFVNNLKVLIVSGSKEKDRFRNFREFIQLNADDSNIRALVHDNAERQVSSYFESPVLQVEPFVLADVYLEPECGILPASETKKALRAFDEKEPGGRVPLLDAVLDKLGDPKFRDVIVIQGPPGAGKSTFTLRLCAELLKQGLCPVRVRMRDLPIEKSLLEAIGDALTVVDGVRLETADYTSGNHLTRLFNESLQFGSDTICPYVFILDAWDEISRFTREGEGFQVRVDRLMAEVRSIFLKQSRPALRVILTGRPSDVIANSPLLHPETPVHTIRPLRKNQLPQYVELLDRAVRKRRFSSDDILPLTLGNLKQYEPVWERDLEVLGLPLLLHLTIRVLSQKPEMIENIGGSPTNLYRRLIDQTAGSAAKPKHAPDQALDTVLPVDPEFRKDLQEVAVAITTLGGEWISFEELGHRCGEEFLQKFRESKGNNPFARLVIGFFFKAGAADGIEFLHKSFREYLFAEAVTGVLLEYGGKRADAPSERAPYWKEFEEPDPRYRILRNRLVPILAAQTLTAEIEGHMDTLISWHLRGEPTRYDPPEAPLDLPRWKIIRDGLADLWDWWGEGVHLRGQPFRTRRQMTEYAPPYILELIDKALPQQRYQLDVDPIPLRTTGADANLGLGIYSLAQSVHYWIASSEGLRGRYTLGESVRRYQRSVSDGEGLTFTLFAPSGPDGVYFLNYIRRIQAAGYDRCRQFPSERRHHAVVLSETYLDGVDFFDSKLFYVNFESANLVRTGFFFSQMYGTNLSDANLSNATLSNAWISEADFTRATCTQQQFNQAEGDQSTVLPEGIERPEEWSR